MEWKQDWVEVNEVVEVGETVEVDGVVEMGIDEVQERKSED